MNWKIGLLFQARSRITLIVNSGILLTALITLFAVRATLTADALSIEARPVAEAAAVTPLLSYQGRLLDPATGAPKPNGIYTFVFRVYNMASGGSELWTETKDLNVSNGLFVTLLGDTTPLPTTIFTGQNLWLGLKVGADAEATPRQRLAPVAYAMYADNASRLDGKASTEFAASNHNHDATYVNKAGPDSMSGRNNSSAILSVTQSGTHDGIFASTVSTDAARAAIHGRAGSAGPSINSVAGVFGTSTSGRGVIGSSNSNDGVYGFSQTGTAIHGQSPSGTGVRAWSSTGTALQVDGAANVTGNLTVGGTINNPMAPIALGFIDAKGTKGVSSSNVSSIWNASSSLYEITISGHSYLMWNYVTVITPACSLARNVSESSGSGKLLVRILNSSGSQIQCDFQFVTYKP